VRLRGSGDILQDADGVWMLEVPKQKEGNIEETPEVAPVDLWIRKQRNGPRNVCVKLAFMKTYTRFEQLTVVSDADVPPEASREYDESSQPPPEPIEEQLTQPEL